MTTEPEETTEAPASATITPEEIQRQEFAVSRFGGYKMRDVDEFLDRLTESTQALLAENERLRGGGPIVGTSDLDEVNRQADEILTRAREEAARIVAEAEAARGGDAAPPAAAAVPAAAVSASAAGRAAVDPFLVQERDFLQRLATLVQGHAESVKEMARKTRQAPPAEGAAAAVATSEPSAETQPASDAGSEADDATGTAAGSAKDTGEKAPPTEAPAEDAPEMVDVRGEADAEPSDTNDDDGDTATERGEEVAAGDARGREGDPSLRNLFWGDER